VSDSQVEIEAICELHQGSGHLVLRWEDDRIMLDGHADRCCVIILRDPAAILLVDVLGEWLG
jgi:hypothetical protein